MVVAGAGEAEVSAGGADAGADGARGGAGAGRVRTRGVAAPRLCGGAGPLPRGPDGEASAGAGGAGRGSGAKVVEAVAGGGTLAKVEVAGRRELVGGGREREVGVGCGLLRERGGLREETEGDRTRVVTTRSVALCFRGVGLCQSGRTEGPCPFECRSEREDPHSGERAGACRPERRAASWILLG